MQCKGQKKEEKRFVFRHRGFNPTHSGRAIVPASGSGVCLALHVPPILSPLITLGPPKETTHRQSRLPNLLSSGPRVQSICRYLAGKHRMYPQPRKTELTCKQDYDSAARDKNFQVLTTRSDTVVISPPFLFRVLLSICLP